MSVLVCRQIKCGKIAYCPFILLSSWQYISHSVPWLILATFNWPLTKYWNWNIQLQLSSSALHLCLITLSCLLCPGGLEVEDLLHTNALDSWFLKLCLLPLASKKREGHRALSRRLSRNSCIRSIRKASGFLTAVQTLKGKGMLSFGCCAAFFKQRQCNDSRIISRRQVFHWKFSDKI